MFIRTTLELGALIRAQRLKLGLDQAALARKTGTSRKWLIEVEGGKPRAEIGLILRTLKALGITLAAAEDAPRKRTRSAPPPVDINQVIDALKPRR